MRPADPDIRTAFDVERAAYEAAQRLAEQGAAMARQAGLEADGLAVEARAREHLDWRIARGTTPGPSWRPGA